MRKDDADLIERIVKYLETQSRLYDSGYVIPIEDLPALVKDIFHLFIIGQRKNNCK